MLGLIGYIICVLSFINLRNPIIRGNLRFRHYSFLFVPRRFECLYLPLFSALRFVRGLSFVFKIFHHTSLLALPPYLVRTFNYHPYLYLFSNCFFTIQFLPSALLVLGLKQDAPPGRLYGYKIMFICDNQRGSAVIIFLLLPPLPPAPGRAGRPSRSSGIGPGSCWPPPACRRIRGRGGAGAASTT